MTTWMPKLPTSREFFTVDFLRNLAAGDSILSATCTASVLTGTDATPANILLNSPIINGTNVSQEIQGGVLGVRYLLTFTATTLLGETIPIAGDFWVLASAPNALDLTTVQAVKDWLKLKADDDDALLQRLVTAQSILITDWLSQPIKSATVTEVYDGTGTPNLVLRAFPVTAVSAVSIAGVALTPTAWTSDDIGVHLVTDYFDKGAGNVSVTYTAGYATVTPSIEQACIELVCFRYKERDRIGISTQALAQGNNTYSLKDFPEQVLTLLKQYKRVTP